MSLLLPSSHRVSMSSCSSLRDRGAARAAPASLLGTVFFARVNLQVCAAGWEHAAKSCSIVEAGRGGPQVPMALSWAYPISGGHSGQCGDIPPCPTYPSPAGRHLKNICLFRPVGSKCSNISKILKNSPLEQTHSPAERAELVCGCSQPPSWTLQGAHPSLPSAPCPLASAGEHRTPSQEDHMGVTGGPPAYHGHGGSPLPRDGRGSLGV